MARMTILVLSLLILFLLCSCGSNGQNSTDGNQTDSLTAMITDSLSFLDSIPDVGFIHRAQYYGDLDSMIQRGFIRVLVPNNRTHYFLDRARQRGLVYENMKAFEKHLNKNIKKSTRKISIFCIPVRRDQLIPLLVNGYGDIASAGLTITERRSKQIDFSIPLVAEVNEVIVSWKNAPPLLRLSDLSGMPVFVRKSSTYFDHLLQLNKDLESSGYLPVNIREADENLETEDILELVNNGNILYTIADDYLANIWRKALDNLIVYDSIPLHRGGSIAYAVRKDSPELKTELDLFVDSHGRGTLFGNIIFNRYLRDNRWIKNPARHKNDQKTERLLSLFKKYGDQYDLDYIFLISLAYQESRLNQNAHSHAGAVGIMQVLPGTAAGSPIYIKDVTKLENNIHAGTKYLRHLMDTYFNDPELSKIERMYFTIAAYNAGPTRISRLRKKAAGSGYDPNHWFDNVEILVAKEVGREPIRYVTNILKNYVVYSMMVERIELRRKALDKME